MTRNKYWIAIVICLLFIIVTFFLPYCVDVTDGKEKASSELAYYDLNLYYTPYTALERPSGIVGLVIVILTLIIIVLARRKWHKYFLIPLIVIYYPFWFLSWFAIGSSGFGARPFGGQTLGGFFLMFLAITTLFIFAWLKPLEEKKK